MEDRYAKIIGLYDAVLAIDAKVREEQDRAIQRQRAEDYDIANAVNQLVESLVQNFGINVAELSAIEYVDFDRRNPVLTADVLAAMDDPVVIVHILKALAFRTNMIYYAGPVLRECIAPFVESILESKGKG